MPGLSILPEGVAIAMKPIILILLGIAKLYIHFYNSLYRRLNDDVSRNGRRDFWHPLDKRELSYFPISENTIYARHGFLQIWDCK